MANPEIKLVFNAETGKASQNIQDLYNKILSLAKNRGSDFTSEEVRKINEMIEAYDKYERKVKGINEYVRSVNITEFGSENQVEKTLDRTEKKLQRIIYDGTQIASLMRSIGIEPRALESYVNLANTLSLANKEFDIAVRNKERLLNQPTAPKNPLVNSYPWEKNGTPDDPNTPEQQFRNKYAKYAEDIGNYQRVLNVTIDSTERLKAALRDKYAALQETDEGYLQQKQLLESLLGTIDKQILAQGKVSESVKTQIEDWEKLYKTTTDSKHWLTGLQEMEKRASGVEQMYQKIQITAENAVGIQNKYNNAQIKNNEKLIKSEQRYQAALETTGLTYQELTQLYSQLLGARARAQTPEQIQAIDRQLTAVRKSITLMGRESQLSGAKMIGAQTSVMGVMHQVVNQWRNGTLTLRGLTLGIKLFAKSTVVLAAIQLAWEGISWALEKAKAAFFGTADAEEKAAEHARDLEEAVKSTGRAAIDAANALASIKHSEEENARSAIAIRLIKQEGEALNANIKYYQKLSKARIEEMEAAAAAAGDEAALKRLQLENDYINGKITATEKAIALKKIEAETAAAADKLKLEKAKEELELRTKLNKEASEAQAAANRRKLEAKRKVDSMMTPQEIKTYNDQRASIEAELVELANKDIGASVAERYDNNIRRRYLRNELQKLNEKRDASGRNTEEEYKAAMAEYQSAEKEEANLFAAYEKYNAQMYEQRDIVKKLSEENERREKTRARVFGLEEKNLKDQEKQTNLDRKNQAKINELKKRVSGMNIDQLKLEESALKEKAAKAKNGKTQRRIVARASVFTEEITRRKALQDAATLEGQYERNTKDALALASGGAYAMLSDGKLTGSEIEKLLKTLRAKNNIQNENLHRLLQEIIAIAISNKMITQKTYDKYKNDLKSAKLNFIDK